MSRHAFKPDHNGECLVCDNWEDWPEHRERLPRRLKQASQKFIRGRRMTPKERRRLIDWMQARRREIGAAPMRARPDGRFWLLDLWP